MWRTWLMNVFKTTKKYFHNFEFWITFQTLTIHAVQSMWCYRRTLKFRKIVFWSTIWMAQDLTVFLILFGVFYFCYTHVNVFIYNSENNQKVITMLSNIHSSMFIFSPAHSKGRNRQTLKLIESFSFVSSISILKMFECYGCVSKRKMKLVPTSLMVKSSSSNTLTNQYGWKQSKFLDISKGSWISSF